MIPCPDIAGGVRNTLRRTLPNDCNIYRLSFCIKYNAKELYRSIEELNFHDSFACTKIEYVAQPHKIDIFLKIHEYNFDYIRALQRKHQ
jgi:hypothetical protein